MGLHKSSESKKGKDKVVLHIDDLLTRGYQEYLERKVALYQGYAMCMAEGNNDTVVLEKIDSLLGQNPPDAIIKIILLAKKAHILVGRNAGMLSEAVSLLRDALTLKVFVDDIPRISLDEISRGYYGDAKKAVNQTIKSFRSLDIPVPETVFAKEVPLNLNININDACMNDNVDGLYLYNVLNLAENGDRKAQGLLATLYFAGNGVRQNTYKGLYWLEKSYTSGIGNPYDLSSDLLALMGRNYEVGATVEKDLKKARAWYEKGVKENSSASILMLGQLHLESGNERLPAKDVEKSISLYRQSADMGNAFAEYYLGCLYHDQKHDFKTAAEWWFRAAKHNEPVSMAKLGELYLSGTGVPQDYARAVNLFKTSAELSEPRGMIHLGRCYLDGTGVKKDYKEGYSWLVKAAKATSVIDPSPLPEAQYWIGYCYYNGFGTVKSKIKAREWIEKAIQGEYEPALAFAEEHPDLNIGNVSGIVTSTYHISGDFIQDNHGIIASDDAIVNRSPVDSTTAKPRFCPECGKSVDEDAKFCKYCGRKL